MSRASSKPLPTRDHEKALLTEGFFCIAGIDEAGRGPLAGPVTAAAVILPEYVDADLLATFRDSKQMTPKQRQIAYEAITAPDSSILWSIGEASAAEIDTLNIYAATQLAMARAIQGLPKKPDYLLLDGITLPKVKIPQQKIIKGDSLCSCISAASILAKHYRDLLMEEYERLWPEYGFSQHKGYGTAKHMEMLRLHGPIQQHRATFAPVREAQLLKNSLA